VSVQPISTARVRPGSAAAAGPPVAAKAPEQVQPGASLSTPVSRLVLAEAAGYTAGQQDAQAALVASVLAVWATLNAKQALASWASGIGTRIYVLLSLLQELGARDANSYVRRVLTLQGLNYTGPDIDPLNFAGLASDGRDLESLLAGAVVTLRRTQEGGGSDALARERGANWLRMVVATQAADAARAAASVSMTVAAPVDQDGKAVQLGWVRVLTPPSCGRCVVLAGKFFRWDAAFERHPNCDCRQVPASESTGDDILADPMLYFNSLTEAEQDRYFGKANAQAIRDGAAIDRVVNIGRRGGLYTADDGRRYTYELARKNGFYGYRKDKVRRPTPWQIYQDANGDQAQAIEALRRFGYITGGPAR
jgi:hypothetical protein